jgi:hypothetical protein
MPLANCTWRFSNIEGWQICLMMRGGKREKWGFIIGINNAECFFKKKTKYYNNNIIPLFMFAACWHPLFLLSHSRICIL